MIFMPLVILHIIIQLDHDDDDDHHMGDNHADDDALMFDTNPFIS